MHATNGTNGTTAHDADAAIDALYSWWPAPPPAPACPEASFSLTLKGKLDGLEALMTIRGQSPEEFQRHLQAVRGLLDQPQAPAASHLSPQHHAAAMHKKVTDFCPIHNVQMKENTKDGRRWFSHYDEAAGRWCKGK